jgi:aspartyl/asparaginyl-tRNA synthetase
LQLNSYISDVIKKVDSPDRRNAGEIEIVDYKEAIKITEKYLEEMGSWANELNNNVEKLYFQAKKDIRLNIVRVFILYL